MEFIDQIGIAKWLILIMPIATLIALNRASVGKPITKAEEQIFTLGIALCGVAMIFDDHHSLEHWLMKCHNNQNAMLL